MKAVQPQQPPDYHTTNSQLTQNPGNKPTTLIDSHLVDNAVRKHFQNERPRDKRAKRMGRQERLQVNGCVSSPVGYDVFLSCSSGSELEWITKQAVPQLQ